MKRSFYTIGSLLILLLAAFVFVLVPVLAGRAPGEKLPAFGKYDGSEIRYEPGTDFTNYVANYADYFKNQGREISSNDYYYIFQYAFNAAVTKIAYTKAVNKSGWKVPQGAVNRAMVPYFTDENGNYSSKLYKQADPQAVEDLQRNFRDSLIVSRYNDDCFGSSETIGKNALFGLKNSSKELAFIQELNGKKRGFNMVSFNMNDYPDSEKAAYGKANSQKFMRYDFSIITCADKSKAEALAKRLANNEITFTDAVGEYSQKSYSNENGKMTSQYYYQIERIIQNEDDLKAVTSLAEEAVSSPVQTSIGYSIFHADSAAVEPDFSDANMLRTVYNYLTSYEFGHIEDYYMENANAFVSVAKNRGFDAACRQMGVEKITVPPFPLNYGSVPVADKVDTSLEGLSGAATNENFFKTAFSLEMNAISDPIVINRNVAVLQYTHEENSAADTSEENAAVLADEFRNYDAAAAQTALLSSPKLKNNMNDVFFRYIMNNE